VTPLGLAAASCTPIPFALKGSEVSSSIASVLENDKPEQETDQNTPAVHWVGVTGNDPCPICGKPDWCSRSSDGRVVNCRRTITNHEVPGWWFEDIHRDKAGQPYSRWQSLGETTEVSKCRPPAPHRVDAAGIKTRDTAYRTFLDHLRLPRTPWAELQRRGLTRSEIGRRQYGYLDDRRGQAVQALVESLSEDQVSRVPGFVRNADGTWTVNGPKGIVIPVRDPDGKIQALKIRRDVPTKDGGKYVYLSSTSTGGPSPGSPLHVPIHDDCADFSTVRVTEGELKADIATARTGILTLGLPGVTAIEKALPILKQVGAKTVLVAFDSDFEQNRTVGDALLRAVHLLRALFTVVVEYWTPTLGKGIDDVLAAGHQPTQIGPEKLEAFLDRVRDLPATPHTAERPGSVIASHGGPRPSSLRTNSKLSRPRKRPRPQARWGRKSSLRPMRPL